MGRLAVDKAYKGMKLGKFLLFDALRRSYEVARSSVGSVAIIVDPLDENAVNFYAAFDFIMLPDSGKMFLMMDTVVELFR